MTAATGVMLVRLTGDVSVWLALLYIFVLWRTTKEKRVGDFYDATTIFHLLLHRCCLPYGEGCFLAAAVARTGSVARAARPNNVANFHEGKLVRDPTKEVASLSQDEE